MPLDLKNNLARMPWGQELDDAVKQALRDMIKLICEIRGRSPQDAYTLSSNRDPSPSICLQVFLLVRDLFRKPVPTFRDHALTTSHPASAGGYLMRSWVLMKPRFTPAGAVS